MLIQAMLEQFSMDLDLSVERDIETILYRCKHEGLSFLTICLPKLSDALEQGLENGRFSCPTDFSRHGSLPRLLGGFFNRVFARSGELLPDADVECIYAIRQICRFFKKLKIGCTPSREEAAIRQYLEVEAELQCLTSQIKREDILLDKVAGIIWSQVFPEIDPYDIVCHHGPGVTADRRLCNQRHRISYWYTRMEHCYPVDLHAYPNYGYAAEDSGTTVAAANSGVEILDLKDEPSVRVVFVPKTQTAPRVIAIEPASMQYVQQGLLDYMTPILENHRLTKNSVRFSDQSINQLLACRSSKDRSLATLDLKEASDRVHFELVRRIFRSSGILDYLESARSLHATLPNGMNVILNKFASMGSAICFPVEACVFYTLIQLAFHRRDGRRPSSSSIAWYSKYIDIYGDDIIVPVDYTDVVVDTLESYGLKVNVNKSFRNSLFRESCGGDFYDGISVKPIYARELLPDDPRQWTAATVMSWVSTADQFYMNGQWKLSQTIRDQLERGIRRRIPRARNPGPGVYFRSLLFDTNVRYNNELCGWEQKRIIYKPSLRKDKIDGDPIACILKWSQRQSRRANADTIRSYGPGWYRISRSDGAFASSDTLFGQSERPLRSVSGLSSLYGKSQNGLRQLRYGDEEIPLVFRDSLSGACIDFTASTKRGGFKSTHRWVMTLS
jgi:hypothetical protein